MSKKMKQVQKMLQGRSPRELAYWFMDRSIILMQESKVPKQEVLDYIEKVWQ